MRRTVGARPRPQNAATPLGLAIRACGSLFGSRAKAATLLALAHGPLHMAAIARLTDTEHVSVLLAVEALAEAGIVVRRRRRNAFDMVGLDRAFPAHAQLRRLLRALAPPPESGRARHRAGMVRAGPRPRLDTSDLFGYPNMADVLVALSLGGEAAPEWLRRVAAIRKEETAQRTLWDLVRIGVVARRRQGRFAFYRLAETWPAARDLRLLLRRFAAERPTLRAAATRRKPRRRMERVGPERLLPFMRPAHARLLIALARGTARATDLADAFSLRYSGVRGTLVRLARTGAIGLRVDGHKLYATLRRDALPPPFAALLDALASTDARIAALPTHAAPPTRCGPCRLPFSSRWLRLFLAAADGIDDPMRAARAAGTTATTARRCLREFARDGSFERIGGRLALAAPLRDVPGLLDALRRWRTEPKPTGPRRRP